MQVAGDQGPAAGTGAIAPTLSSPNERTASPIVAGIDRVGERELEGHLLTVGDRGGAGATPS